MGEAERMLLTVRGPNAAELDLDVPLATLVRDLLPVVAEACGWPAGLFEAVLLPGDRRLRGGQTLGEAGVKYGQIIECRLAPAAGGPEPGAPEALPAVRPGDLLRPTPASVVTAEAVLPAAEPAPVSLGGETPVETFLPGSDSQNLDRWVPVVLNILLVLMMAGLAAWLVWGGGGALLLNQRGW